MKKGERRVLFRAGNLFKGSIFDVWGIRVKLGQERDAKTVCLECFMVAFTRKGLQKAAIGWGRGVEPAPTPPSSVLG